MPGSMTAGRHDARELAESLHLICKLESGGERRESQETGERTLTGKWPGLLKS